MKRSPPPAHCHSPLGHKLNDFETTLLSQLIKLESEKKSAVEKAQMIFAISLQRKRIDSSPDFEDFKFLVHVRNEIIHPKGERLIQVRKGSRTNGNVRDHMAHVRRLEQSKLIERILVNESWLNKLGPRFIEWSLATTTQMIAALLTALPETALMTAFRRNARIDLGSSHV
ncbi:hypothetical protein D3C73_1158890 [compost metagenome]